MGQFHLPGRFSRDPWLVYLPVPATVAVMLAALGLAWGGHRLLRNIDREYDTILRQKAGLTAQLVGDKLRSGDTASAAGFCRAFDNRVVRLTLISPEGTVLADSDSALTRFDNHAERPEVVRALAGEAAFSRRYSGTLNCNMRYYAIPLAVEGRAYVLRFAHPANPFEETFHYLIGAILLLALFAAFALIWLQCYLVRRVYRPLYELGTAAAATLGGEDCAGTIPVPPAGPVRPLAAAVSGMTDRLRDRLHDVTDERNERAALFDAMSEAVLLFAPDGSLVRANRAAAGLFEFPANGEPFNLSRCRIPELLECVRATRETGVSFEREFALETDTGTRSLFVKGRPTAGGRLLLTVTELTNLRKLESFRRDFVANVSHEIKTPLTCIVGAVEALEDSPDAATQRRLLNMLGQQSKRLNNLVRDILSLAALEKQQSSTDREFTWVDLDAVADNAVNLFAGRAAAAGFRLTAATATATATATGGLPLEVRGDAALLEQAVGNLIENAVRYSGGHAIAVSVSREAGVAVLAVADDGIGIPEAHRPRIFERFYRVDKSRSRELGGTGLGLAIVKHIAQLHGGTAELIVPDGGGCVFRLVIPLRNPVGADAEPACFSRL